MLADQILHLRELNKASAEGWQALSQEDKDHFQSRVAEEQVSLCPKVDLKQILNQLSKLVCQIYLCMLTNSFKFYCNWLGVACINTCIYKKSYVVKIYKNSDVNSSYPKFA